MSATATAKRARRKKATVEEVRLALRDQPLVGLRGSAKLLGIAPSNVGRLRKQGRMPQGIPVEGAAMVYLRSEVLALAKELAAERAERRG